MHACNESNCERRVDEGILGPSPICGRGERLMKYCAFFRDDVITHESVTHVVLVSIRSDSNARVPPNNPLFIDVLRNNRKYVVVDRKSIMTTLCCAT